MTRQALDTIMINGHNHWLARSVPILPPGHAERIGLERKSESTANYKGWDAHWKIEDERMWLAELWVFGFLGREKLKKLKECADEEELKAAWTACAVPRRIDFKEIFGTQLPLFASWVSEKLIAISTRDDTQYRLDDFGGVAGARTRFVRVENGLVVSDATLSNAKWDPECSEHRRRQAEREKAIRAAEAAFERRRRDGWQGPE